MTLAELDVDILPALPLSQTGCIPQISAVYFLYIGEEIAYIGVTRQLRTRLKVHRSGRFKDCLALVTFRWLDCSSAGWHGGLPVDIERYFLGLYSPPFNHHLTRRTSYWPGSASDWRRWHDFANIDISRLTLSYTV